MEIPINEIEGLRKIVESVFKINLLEKCRARHIVYGRRVYSKILYDKGYTLQAIGDTIEKDHATILHYLRNIETDFKHDNVFYMNYNKCLNIYKREVEGINVFEIEAGELVLQLNLLKDKYNQLNEEYIKLLDFKAKVDEEDFIYKNIFKLIKERTPKGKVNEIEQKINAMYNGLSTRKNEIPTRTF